MAKFIFYFAIIIGCFWVFGNAVIDDEKCKDKVNNLVESHSPKDIPYPAKILNFTGTVYDSEQNPTCSNKQPTVLMPGWVRLLGGELNIFIICFYQY
uniref:Uncharacterized protein n=1 Tax=Panagrolaimus superbus TaxID=310955 RepID=A0A914Y3J6_9BILA